ncbi:MULTISPECIES: MshP protein [unclassified Photobacterium]|uniref:MshP protein n=1 Tax=unclassified Photobacterium TaxID=2628852 RepID=UPI001EE081DE|nr:MULTISPECIES: MshP protein [unclassified Photobacterium]MCG3862833.1 MshP protein [Photobacterium sp. Ph6]MCG3874302.1 MshP protein [Photobacterium sp. Ph5]
MYYKSYAKQRGSGLMIVLFVIVVMGLMAMAMTKIGTSSQTMTTKEVLGTRAWFTAHSANEVVLTELFPLEPLQRKPGVCKNYSASEIATEIDMPEFQTGCKVIQVNCQKIEITALKTTEFKVESTAVCGSGKITMTRTQEVWAKELKNNNDNKTKTRR